MILQGDWHGCYRDGWQGLIVPDAFAHPAKFSRGLIRRIYDHMREEGWLPPVSVILDPFGGVALGALDAMRIGCEWIGVELEERFVKLGEQNIARWNSRFSSLPGWGSAVILQGDSRKLLTWNFAGPKVEAVVGSPPFSPDQPCASQSQSKKDYHAFTRGDGTKRDHVMRSPGQIAAMKEGEIDSVISSPPYAGSVDAKSHGIDWSKAGPATGNRKRGKGSKHEETLRAQLAYGKAPGQLAALPEGDVNAVISSPPYVSGGHHPDQTGAWGGKAQPGDKETAGYGHTDGQLGHMPEGYHAVVSSPPYEGDRIHAGGIDPRAFAEPHRAGGNNQATTMKEYGRAEGQIGNAPSDTFWSAARTILEQCFLAVRPGGHAVFVVKAFVRNGKRVDFPGQWRQVCEAVGFRCVHVHRAWLVEDNGTQQRTDGGETRLTKERKSFFRRLAEKKGSPRIDWEDVICFERRP